MVAIIDYNKLQSIESTHDTLNLEPFAEKWIAFGWQVIEVDGHNIEMIENALKTFSYNSSKPNAIICHTVKGKGFPFAEHNEDWHHKSNLKPEELNAMYNCLEL